MLRIILFIKGCLLGITAIIPGVSIGTMALVLEVYEKSLQSVVLFLNPRNWRNIALCKSAFLFLLPLVFGVLISMFIVSKLLFTLFQNHGAFLYFAFLGMICGSIPHVFKNYVAPMHSGRKWLQFFFYCALGIALIYFLSSSSEAPTQNEVVIFSFEQAMRALLCGLISAAAGVVPGISGSYMLLLMGYYETFLYIMSTPLASLAAFFLIGSLLGFVCVAVLVNFLFTKFPAASYAIVFGIVIGSIFRVIPREQLLNLTVPQFLLALPFVFLGSLFITVVTAFQAAHSQQLSDSTERRRGIT